MRKRPAGRVTKKPAGRKVSSGQGSRPPAYRLHVRVLGIVERNGKMALAMAPNKLVPKAGRPPVESTEEVLSSRLLDRLHRRKKIVCFQDGAWAWTAALKKKGLDKRVICKVSKHYLKQFAHRVNNVPPGHSKIAGTMSIDSRWLSLQTYMPKELSGKTKGTGLCISLRDCVTRAPSRQ